MTWAIRDEDTKGSRRGTVAAPLRHDGIGDALRVAYLPRACDLPRDLVDLLGKLR